MPQAGQLVDSATFQMLTMIGDGMVAAVVILVSLLLLVVGLLCLRFSFLTAAEQDYREIGVLKAIGVAPTRRAQDLPHEVHPARRDRHECSGWSAGWR
jgi:putative ABC transport system permease protein